MSKITCCQISTIYQNTYSEQIQGKRYYSLGFQTGYYHLFKDLKKENQLCKNCLGFSQELFEIYLDFKQKYQNICPPN